MQNIIDRYDDLVKTYETVAASSGGKVYVVAYPQVAKPGGNCGANVNLNADEVQFSADLITYLNSILNGLPQMRVSSMSTLRMHS